MSARSVSDVYNGRSPHCDADDAARHQHHHHHRRSGTHEYQQAPAILKSRTGSSEGQGFCTASTPYFYDFWTKWLDASVLHYGLTMGRTYSVCCLILAILVAGLYEKISVEGKLNLGLIGRYICLHVGSCGDSSRRVSISLETVRRTRTQKFVPYVNDIFS